MLAARPAAEGPWASGAASASRAARSGAAPVGRGACARGHRPPGPPRSTGPTADRHGHRDRRDHRPAAAVTIASTGLALPTLGLLGVVPGRRGRGADELDDVAGLLLLGRRQDGDDGDALHVVVGVGLDRVADLDPAWAAGVASSTPLGAFAPGRPPRERAVPRSLVSSTSIRLDIRPTTVSSARGHDRAGNRHRHPPGPRPDRRGRPLRQRSGRRPAPRLRPPRHGRPRPDGDGRRLRRRPRRPPRAAPPAPGRPLPPRPRQRRPRRRPRPARPCWRRRSASPCSTAGWPSAPGSPSSWSTPTGTTRTARSASASSGVNWISWPTGRKVRLIRGPARGHLGHGVVPGALAGAAHDQQVAPTELVADRAARRPWAATGMAGARRPRRWPPAPVSRSRATRSPCQATLSRPSR